MQVKTNIKAGQISITINQSATITQSTSVTVNGNVVATA